MKPADTEIKIDVLLNCRFGQLYDVLTDKLTVSLTALIGQLGIPGKPIIDIKTDETDFIRLFVNQTPLSYSVELTERVYDYILSRGMSLSKEILPVHSFSKEKKYVIPTNELKPTAEFFTLLVLESIKMCPSCLFDKDQFMSYWKSLDIQEIHKTLDQKMIDKLCTSFREILDLQISLVNQTSISEIINSYESITDQNIDQLREVVIDIISASEVVIEINPKYFRLITELESELYEENKFSLMRDGLYYEQGLHYPNLKLEFSNDIALRYFRFKVNDLISLSFTGLELNSCLVNDTVDRLTLLNIEGNATTNPANGIECSIISEGDKETAEQAGLTTWSALGYFILCLSSVLKNLAKCFVNNTFVQGRLDRFANAYPELVEVIRSKVSTENLTQILRMLVYENTSIRDFRLILEAISEQDYIEADPAKYIVLDDRLPVMPAQAKNTLENTVNFIRSRMKEYISHKYLKGRNTLIVYLLDPAIEEMIKTSIENKESVSNENVERILNAIQKEETNGYATSDTSVILTFSRIRYSTKKLIKDRFPRMSVLAYKELSPQLSIQPIARISL